MLRYFFEIGGDSTLFDGLYIAGNRELCEKWMGQYPVISISLKDVKGDSYALSKHLLALAVQKEAARFSFLLSSDGLDEDDRKTYRTLKTLADNGTPDDFTVMTSLGKLSVLLQKHYGREVIILIDEYDVPLDNAFEKGFYEGMVNLIRVFMSSALKTNTALKKAFLTGCLRISRESIFTGLNNLKIYSISDHPFDEAFGFEDGEVRKLLSDYDLSSRYDIVREWYDGYVFGDSDVYCPWDVLNYVQDALSRASSRPQSYWSNSGSNSFLRTLLLKADYTTRAEIETLIEGGSLNYLAPEERGILVPASQTPV